MRPAPDVRMALALRLAQPQPCPRAPRPPKSWYAIAATDSLRMTPAHAWFLAEAATGLSVGFQYLTIFNPSNEAVTATIVYYGATGAVLGGSESLSAASADLLTPAVPLGPSPYTLADGVPGPTTVAVEGSEEVVIGRKAPSARGAPGRSSPGSSVGVERQLDGISSSSSGPSWYGSHVSVGRKP